MTVPRARHRLFVALEISAPLAAEIDGLRRAIGSTSLGRIAPHLSLIPPVNIAEGDLAAALECVRSVAHEYPIEVELGPAGTFLPRTPVLFLEVHEPAGRLARLQRMLEAPPLAPPADRPKRPFAAHVTLSSRMSRAAIAAAVPVFAQFRATTVLRRLTLYEQHHEEERHPWSPLADVLLGAGSAPDRGGRALGFVVSHLAGPDLSSALFACSSDATALAVIGREGGEVVAQAAGVIFGARLVVESWCVSAQRRGEGIGRALIRACARAASALGATGVVVAAASEDQRGFLTHLGLAPASVLREAGAFGWFALR